MSCTILEFEKTFNYLEMLIQKIKLISPHNEGIITLAQKNPASLKDFLISQYLQAQVEYNKSPNNIDLYSDYCRKKEVFEFWRCFYNHGKD